MLTVNRAPKVETEILENAAARGQETDQYVGKLIQLALRQSVPSIIPAKISTEEFLRQWTAEAAQARQFSEADRLAARYDPAYRREDIYDDDER